MSGVFSRMPFELFRQQLERRDKKRLDWGKSFKRRGEGRGKMEIEDPIFLAWDKIGGM